MKMISFITLTILPFLPCLSQLPNQAAEALLRIDLISDVYKKDINFLFSLKHTISVGSCYIKRTKWVDGVTPEYL